MQNESLITYPCDFPIKIMGKQHPDFCTEIITLVQQFDASFDASQVEYRASRGGNYIGITVTIRATSRAQLDALYKALSGHTLVKVVL
ncbi:MAG: DUF493 family protein [Ottowia sp.]|nr:DUF493 family protein [Ottowia sp.]